MYVRCVHAASTLYNKCNKCTLIQLHHMESTCIKNIRTISAQCPHAVNTLSTCCTVMSSLFPHCVSPSYVCLSQTKCTNFFPTNCTLHWISSIRICFTFLVVCYYVPFNLKWPCTTMLAIKTLLLLCLVTTYLISMLV